MVNVNQIRDVHNLLKGFGIVIYTGDSIGDLELMLDEVKELKDTGLIDNEEYLKAISILKMALKSNRGSI